MTLADVPNVLGVEEPSATLGLGQVFPQDEYPFPRDAIAGRWQEEIASLVIECLVIEQQA